MASENVSYSTFLEFVKRQDERMERLLHTVNLITEQQGRLIAALCSQPHFRNDASTYAAVVRVNVDAPIIKEKVLRAVIVGYPEGKTSVDSDKRDDALVRELLAEIPDVGKEWESQHRHLEFDGKRTRVLKVQFKSQVARDAFLRHNRGRRPEALKNLPSAYCRRDLTSVELQMEKAAKATAKQRNIECGELAYGVRDTECIKYRSSRPLPPFLQREHDKWAASQNTSPYGSHSPPHHPSARSSQSLTTSPLLSPFTGATRPPLNTSASLSRLGLDGLGAGNSNTGTSGIGNSVAGVSVMGGTGNDTGGTVGALSDPSGAGSA